MTTVNEVAEFIVSKFGDDLGEGGEDVLNLTSTHHHDAPRDGEITIETKSGQYFRISIREGLSK